MSIDLFRHLSTSDGWQEAADELFRAARAAHELEDCAAAEERVAVLHWALSAADGLSVALRREFEPRPRRLPRAA